MVWSCGISQGLRIALECVHRKTLRTIQGLPTCCPSSLSALMGFRSIATYIQLRSLAFVVTTTNLPIDTVAWRILTARATSNPQRGVMKCFQELLALHNLPDLITLLDTTPTSSAFIKKSLSLKAHLDLVEECESYHLSSCDFKPLRPYPHWAVTLGNVADQEEHLPYSPVGCL